MRFSLKWILVAAVYVAVAAAAFSQPSWVYADILWAMSLLAIVYAGLMVFIARGRARIAAGGFLLASACFLVYVTTASLIGNNSAPMTRLLVAAGYEKHFPQPYSFFSPVALPTPTVSAVPVSGNASGTLSLSFVPPPTAQTPPPAAPVVDFAQYVRAANAIGMMGFGLLGILVGLLAARAAAPEPVRSGD